MKESLIIDFTLVYNRHKKPLFNYLMKITRSRMLAEDIIHNVFLKLYENASLIREPEKVEFWLFSTARNEAMNSFRKNTFTADCGTEFPEIFQGDPFADIENNEMRTIIMKELEKMDSSQSEVFILKEYSGMSYKDVSGVLNIPEDLVKSRLYKVREKLKAAIKQIYIGEK